MKLLRILLTLLWAISGLVAEEPKGETPQPTRDEQTIAFTNAELRDAEPEIYALLAEIWGPVP